MKLLLLTQYFPPEVGAPQNRLFELAVRLKKSGVNVTVLTAMPNYPQMEIHDAYRNKKYVKEEMGGMEVHRASIYVSKSKSIIKRLMNYFSFVWSSMIIGSSKLDKHYDYIMVESPPLFLGISAYYLAKRKGAKLIFNVSDLWPESAEKLGLVTNKLFLKLATWLEEFMYKQSALITGQTQGIVADISSRFPDKNVYWLPNGVDVSFYNPENIKSNWRKDNGFSDSDKLFLYAGILGYAQGLEVIINAAEQVKSNSDLKFVFLGSGPEKEKLIALKREKQLGNVFFYDVVAKDKMPFVVKAIDVSIVPLKKLDLFKGAIPSKIFENLSMGKPILLGVEGEAKELFIDEGKTGLFFEPEDHVALANQIEIIAKDEILLNKLSVNAREYVSAKFNRNKIAAEFYDVLGSL